jgi:hypothetical protein
LTHQYPGAGNSGIVTAALSYYVARFPSVQEATQKGEDFSALVSAILVLEIIQRNL